MIVVIQALSYGFGHRLWTFFERGLIKEFIMRSKSSKDMAFHFKKTLGGHTFYVFKMIFFESLLMLIVIANYIFTNWYLSWNFYAFGFTDVASKVFPKQGIFFYIIMILHYYDKHSYGLGVSSWQKILNRNSLVCNDVYCKRK